jgi:hypothetical protein
VTTPDDVGPVPEDNRPGHHPDHEQDKPDPDAFARRLGLVADDQAPEPDRPGGAPQAVPPVARAARATPPRSAGAAGPVQSPSRFRPPPASPADPVALITEAIGLSMKATVAMTLLPFRLTVASAQLAARAVRRG